MSSPVSTSTITATTLLTLMCVDASVSKNQSELPQETDLRRM